MRVPLLIPAFLLSAGLWAQLPFSFSGSAGGDCVPQLHNEPWPGTTAPANAVQFNWSATNATASPVQLTIRVYRDTYLVGQGFVSENVEHTFTVTAAPNTTTTGTGFWPCASTQFENNRAHSVRVSGPAGTCTAFSMTVALGTPAFANDAEGNNSFGDGALITVGTDNDGRLLFTGATDDDWYRINLPAQGKLVMTLQSETPGATASTMQADLYYTTGTHINGWTGLTGTSNVPSTNVFEQTCRGGSTITYYLRLRALGGCDVSYRLTLSVVAPVFGIDPVADNTLVPYNTYQDGQQQFDSPSDNSDIFAIAPPFNGVMSIEVQAEHAGPVQSTMQVRLLYSTGTVVQTWNVPSGANGVPITTVLSIPCRGTSTSQRISFQSAACGASYRFKYSVAQPLFSNDTEPNSSTGQAFILPEGQIAQGQVNFADDDNTDYYRANLTSDGVMHVNIEAEHADVSTAETITVNLYISTGSLLQSWTAPVGANSIAISTPLSVTCRGNTGNYYLRINSSVCGTSYRISYSVTPPLFAQDVEPNNSVGQAIVLPITQTTHGHLDFYFGDNSDEYRLNMPTDGVLHIAFEAEHADTSTTETVQLQLRTSAGFLLQTWTAPVGANSVAVSSTHDLNCRGTAIPYYLSLASGICGASYRVSYTVTPPFFANDTEPNNSPSQAFILAPSTTADGHVNFHSLDNLDEYRLDLPNDGVLNVAFQAEHAGASAVETIQLELRTSAGSLLQAWTAPVGAGSVAVSSTHTLTCRGTAIPYYLSVESGVCGVSYRVSYTVTPPVFANDPEPNNSSPGTPMNLNAGEQQGHIGFYNTTDNDYYAFTHPGGAWSVTVSAEHAGTGAGTMTMEVRNNPGTLFGTFTVPVGGSSTALTNTFTIPSLAAGSIYRLIMKDVTCGVSYRIHCYDTDGDGVCNGSDLCAGAEPGTPCDDGNPNTINDVVGSNCACAGTGITLLSSFNPTDAAGFCGVAYDADSTLLWAYDCSAAIIQQYTTTGTFVRSIPRPGESTNDVDLSMTPEQVALGTSTVPYGRLLMFNGETGTADIYGIQQGPGTVIASLATAFGLNHVVGGAYHPIRNSYFLVQDDDANAADENRVAEVDPVTGAVLSTFQFTGTYAVNFGDLEISAANGNLFLVSNTQTSIAEFTPQGAFVTLHPLPVGVTSLTGLSLDCATGTAWASNSSGIIYHLGNFPCSVIDACPGGPEPGSACNDNDACTTGDVIGANCVCAGTFQDSDGDGTCNANDLCPGGPEPGSACNDNNVCTTADVIQANCLCAGTLADADADGTCDANDLCPGGPEPGTTCNDNNGATINDIIQANCLCAGTLLGNDCEGVPGGPAVPGTACNDNNACTTSDVYGTNCLCAGTFADADADGTCDANDLCPGGPEPGTACNDNNACTTGDVIGANCLCAGTFTDADADGTCDVDDLCPGGPEPGTTCNDNNACTTGDVIGSNCLCAGTFADADADGTCDASDLCPGGPEPGTTCNDNNACTTGDVIGSNCLCAGTFADADNDGTCDASDLCPGGPEPGTPCDDGSAATNNDVIGANCLCSGTPSGGGCTQNEVTLTLSTDANGQQTSYDIVSIGTSTAICSGSSFASNATIPLACCLPNGCYELRVFDSAGDGILPGGYVLTDAAGKRIIDNGGDGIFTSVSQIPNNLGFCVPIGTNQLAATSCDKIDWMFTDIIQAQPDPAVTAQYGVTNGTSGYQFWFFNPDGGYTRRIAMTHAAPGITTGPANIRASYLKLNSLVTSPLPAYTNLNVRVRTQVAGVYNQFGPACRFRLDPPCAVTKLTSTADPVVSCGATGLSFASHIYATTVAGATTYQFEFSRPGYLRRIASTSRSQQLTWSTSPLMNNTCYEVRVRVSFDNAQTYCSFGPVCTVTIGAATCGGMMAEQDNSGLNGALEARMMVWPNPNGGHQVSLSLVDFDASVNNVMVDVTDAFGKLITTRNIAVRNGYMNTVLPFEQDLAPGLYLVNLQAGEQRFTERLVIQ